VGSEVVISAGVTIGKFAAIESGSVVAQDVPDHALMVGSPARQVGYVCKCTTQLVEDGIGSFDCPKCGEHYQRVISVETGEYANLFSPRSNQKAER
jgi:UDP-2-acetamido-3-amino-2,3-dideoxy-glucuronate N-acetyltransferase